MLADEWSAVASRSWSCGHNSSDNVHGAKGDSNGTFQREENDHRFAKTSPQAAPDFVNDSGQPLIILGMSCYLFHDCSVGNVCGCLLLSTSSVIGHALRRRPCRHAGRGMSSVDLGEDSQAQQVA